MCIMRHILLVFAALFVGSESINCPSGFSALNDRKCVMLFTDKQLHSDAVANCSKYNGHLISISNAIDNKALIDLANSKSTTPFWLGLKCATDGDPSSCYWDDQSGNAGSYNAFAKGQPIIDSGECVYMSVSGSSAGKWLSGMCDLMTIDYVCEAPSVDPVDDTCSFKFNGYCYFPTLSSLSEDDAQFACQQNCANLVSIHSAAENDYITKLITNNAPRYLRIGGLMSSDGKFAWSDGSTWDYSNIGYSNINLGECLSMALGDGDIVGKGQWISSKCDTQLPFICKRQAGMLCTSTTVAPNQCSGPQFFDNSGTIYSPRYPQSYAGETNICNYVLDTPVGSLAQVQFPEMVLDSGSSIAIYSRIEDTSPIVVLEGNSASARWYNSTTNTMKIVFRPNTGTFQNPSTIYKWRANFKPSNYVSTPAPLVTVTPNPYNPSGCNSTLLVAPGVITSPNYPDNYPNNLDCLYHLTTSGGYRIQLTLDDVSTEGCCDIIVVRDGPYLSSPELGRLSGSRPASSIPSYISSSNSILVSFTTDFSQSSTGFRARFSVYSQ